MLWSGGNVEDASLRIVASSVSISLHDKVAPANTPSTSLVPSNSAGALGVFNELESAYTLGTINPPLVVALMVEVC